MKWRMSIRMNSLPRFVAALLLATATTATAQPAGGQPLAAAIDQRVERVLTTVPLSDGHNDWPMALRQAYGVEGAKTADLYADPSKRTPPGHTSIPWARQGHLGLQLWSVYVSANQPPADAVKQTFEQIAIVRAMAANNPKDLQLVTTADEAEAAFKAGRIASFIALEGAHQIDDDIATLRRAYAQGVRSMTLAHSLPTKLFDSATAPPRHNGMAEGGKAMIAEMNRLGVLVDLSHVSPDVMRQALDVTKAPVIFSHSGARAITDHPRDVPDDVLKRLPANGGIVMVTFVPAFIDQHRTDWEKARPAAGPDRVAWEKTHPRPVSTLAMVADHIDHVAKVAGYDHVGIGGDFDGIPDTPKGLEDVRRYPALFAELARRGWSDANLEKLAGRNFLRVLRANEAVARQLQGR